MSLSKETGSSDETAPMPDAFRLLEPLADGCFHSESELAQGLGVNRSAIPRLAASLNGHHVGIDRLPGKGYRWVKPLELLDVPSIRDRLTPASTALLTRLELFRSIDSTNRYLTEGAAAGWPAGSVCVAEHQSAGRGRRGRRWVSPFGNLSLSVLWRLNPGGPPLDGLSLAMGVVTVGVLTGLGVEGAGLKWPNDVLWQGRKLAGILVEAGGNSTAGPWVVVGIGLNVELGLSQGADIGQSWVDLSHAMTGSPERNRIAAAMVEGVLNGLDRFSRDGFGGFAGRWREHDLAFDQSVVVHLPDRQVAGKALGVDHSGALMLRADGSVQRFSTGELSLRFLP